jgi:hypothetical protein
MEDGNAASNTPGRSDRSEDGAREGPDLTIQPQQIHPGLDLAIGTRVPWTEQIRGPSKYASRQRGMVR